MALKFVSLLSIEYFAMDLIMEDDSKRPCCTAMCMEGGSIYRFGAHSHTHGNRHTYRGFGHAYQSCTSAHTCTKDGSAMASQAGLPMQNLDLVQLHPAGTSRSWILYVAACGVETLGGALGPTQAALSARIHSRNRSAYGTLKRNPLGNRACFLDPLDLGGNQCVLRT